VVKQPDGSLTAGLDTALGRASARPRDAEGERLEGRQLSVPLACTVSNWLKQFTQTTLQPLVDLNHALVMEAVERLGLARLMGLAVQLSERSALLEAEAGVSEPRLPFKH